MDIVLDPPRGVAPVRLGMTFEEAVEATAAWGEVRVLGPLAHNPTVKVQALAEGYDVLVLLEKEDCVTAVDIAAPEDEDADVRVLFQDIDVFRTPAREALQQFADRGYEVDFSNPEYPKILNLTLHFSRETSREVPRDPEDGFSLYFESVLVEKPAEGAVS